MLSGVVASVVAILNVIAAIVLGTTHVIPATDAILYGSFGSIGIALILGSLTGFTFYVIQMWNTWWWADEDRTG